jgi:hypothetical protein
METIKVYTDISQSKKLAEILPIESADMFCADVFDKEKESHSYNFHILSTWGCNTFEELKDRENKFVHFIPCWSLTALLNILNSIDGWYPGIDAQVGEDKLWQICMFSYETGSDISTAAINKELVDTCYEVIIKLKEKNLL